MNFRRVLVVLGLVAALAACGTYQIVTDPSAYSVKGLTIPLKQGQRVALVNGYEQPTPVMFGDRLQADMRQVTDTAIVMMTRHLQSTGVRVDSGAPKKVTLKVIRANTYYMAIPFAERFRTNMDMEAALGDGTNVQVHSENSAPAAFRGQVAINRSVEGAAVFAVTRLLNDGRFASYVNQ